MSIIAQDLKDLFYHVAKENTVTAWRAYLALLEALSVDTEEATIGESSYGFKKAKYYHFSGGSMICVRGNPASPDGEVKAYDSIGD